MRRIYGEAEEKPDSSSLQPWGKDSILAARWWGWLTAAAFISAILLLAMGWLSELYSSQLSYTFESLFMIHAESYSVWALDLAVISFCLAFLGASVTRRRLFQSTRRMASEYSELLSEAKASEMEVRIRNEELDRLTELHYGAAKRFEELFQGLPVACFTYDAQGTMFECNRVCERLSGFHAHELHQRPLVETVWRGADSEVVKLILEKVFSGRSIDHCELQIAASNGEPAWVLLSTFPIKSPKGAVTGAICAEVDITDRKRMESQIEDQINRLNQNAIDLEMQRRNLKEANERLHALANTDSLTGVANRRVFREQLDKAVADAQIQGEPLSVILLDVDHFKQYNDTFGHQAGDYVLSRVAEILRDGVRLVDLAARFGGEEFVLLLQGADENTAMSVAERLRKTIEQSDWHGRRVTASFGVTTGRGKGLDARVLLEDADSAMYTSKKAGRNRVLHWREVKSKGKHLKAA